MKSQAALRQLRQLRHFPPRSVQLSQKSQVSQGSVLAGPADLASSTFKDARGNYAAEARSSQLTGIADKADLNAAVTNSGLNLDNATRQRVASVLNNPKLIAGFSPEEIAALNEVARGTPTRNAIRFVGNLLGGGGGLGVRTGSAPSFPGTVHDSPHDARMEKERDTMA